MKNETRIFINYLLPIEKHDYIELNRYYLKQTKNNYWIKTKLNLYKMFN